MKQKDTKFRHDLSQNIFSVTAGTFSPTWCLNNRSLKLRTVKLVLSGWEKGKRAR